VAVLPRQLEHIIQQCSNLGALRIFASSCALSCLSRYRECDSPFLDAARLAGQCANDVVTEDARSSKRESLYSHLIVLEQDLQRLHQEVSNANREVDDYLSVACRYWSYLAGYACVLQDGREAARMAALALTQFNNVECQGATQRLFIQVARETVAEKTCIQENSPCEERAGGLRTVPRYLHEFITTANDARLRLFACRCAETVLTIISSHDQRVIAAVNTANRYAAKQCSAEELLAAYQAVETVVREGAQAEKQATEDEPYPGFGEVAASITCVAKDCARLSAFDAAMIFAAREAIRVYEFHLKQLSHLQVQQLAVETL
jgi:hypothetical protein